MFIDTDVIIWYLRGKQKAFDFIENHRGFYISVVTYIEIVQGMRNKQELNYFKKQFRNWKAKIIYINEDISAKSVLYIEKHYLSSSLTLADALIGASTIAYGIPLVTCNEKHYKMIGEIEIVKF